MNNKEPSLALIIIKCILLAIVTFSFTINVVNIYKEEAAKADWEVDILDSLSYCDNCVEERLYSDLYLHLHLYDLNNTRYDKYWQVIEGYRYYINYVEQNDLDALMKLNSLKDNAIDSENENIFAEFIENIENNMK